MFLEITVLSRVRQWKPTGLVGSVEVRAQSSKPLSGTQYKKRRGGAALCTCELHMCGKASSLRVTVRRGEEDRVMCGRSGRRTRWVCKCVCLWSTLGALFSWPWVSVSP